MTDKLQGDHHETTLRVEDGPLIRGEGNFVDDLKLPNQATAAFVRSPYPHAKIKTISTEAAQAMPGVVAVLTNADLDGVGSVSMPRSLKGRDDKDLVIPERPALSASQVSATVLPTGVIAPIPVITTRWWELRFAGTFIVSLIFFLSKESCGPPINRPIVGGQPDSQTAEEPDEGTIRDTAHPIRACKYNTMDGV